jgi:hypothetical protein
MSKFRGTGTVNSTDYKSVKWVGKTKSGKACTVEFEKAINLGNIDWTFAEKDDVVPEITFTAVYSNTDETATSTTEPWTLETDEATSGAGEILLGTGVFYIGDAKVALTRGGGKFTVEREFREINADGDRGPVEGRIEIDGSRATLTMNMLTMLTKFADIYAGIEIVATEE